MAQGKARAGPLPEGCYGLGHQGNDPLDCFDGIAKGTALKQNFGGPIQGWHMLGLAIQAHHALLQGLRQVTLFCQHPRHFQFLGHATS